MANYKFNLLILNFILLFFSLSFAQSTLVCTTTCETKFGVTGGSINSEPTGDALKECGDVNTPTYDDYSTCTGKADDLFQKSRNNCQSYLSNGCSTNECLNNYNTCMSQSLAYKNTQVQICRKAYWNFCYQSCVQKCDSTEEVAVLDCVSNSCTLVKKSDFPNGDYSSCDGKKEGNVCGYAVACVQDTCQLVKATAKYKITQCKDRLIGEACCTIKTGDTGQYTIDKTEVEVERSWFSLGCKWKKYEWQSVAPYDPQICKYNWDKKITKKVLVDSGSDSGLIETIFCGYNTNKPWFDPRGTEFASPGSTSKKG